MQFIDMLFDRQLVVTVLTAIATFATILTLGLGHRARAHHAVASGAEQRLQARTDRLGVVGQQDNRRFPPAFRH